MQSTILAFSALLLGVWAAAPTWAQDLVLADGGRSDFRIVVADDASPSTRYGAEELQHWLQAMTGAKLAIVSDSTPPRSHEIILGDNAHLKALNADIDFASLGDEGYVLRTIGPHLVIAGGALRGTLYGAYGLLEDHLGCRWFTPEVSRIPSTPHLVLPPLDETTVPRLEYREPFVKDCFDGDWCARNRVNSNAASLTEKHGGKVSYYGFVHTFYDLVPPSKYYQEHPEYFPLVGGQRLDGYTQLCCTNEDAIRIVTEEVRKRMREHPEAMVFSVSQNDTGSPCQCPECQRLVEQEGTQAAPVLYLVNRVAEAVEKEFPDKAIDTLAYQWSRKPPKSMRPRPNVIVRLCSIECCFSHPLATCDSAENRAFREDIVGWGKVCDRIWVWDYTTSFANYLVPFPNRHVLRDNIRFFADNHVRGIFEEDTYTTLAGEFNSLDGYMQAKFLWNPDYNDRRAMREFLEGVYGPAWRPIREYIDLLRDKVVHDNIHMHIWEGAGAPYLTDDLLAQADQLWDEAEAAVADQPEVLNRVRVARLSLDWALLERTRQPITSPYRIRDGWYQADIDPVFRRRVERFFAAAESGGLTAMNEGGVPVSEYRKRIAPKIGSFEVVALQDDALRLDIVPGLGGRLIGVTPLPGGRNLAYVAAPDEPGYPAAGGYAESWQGAAQGPGWADAFESTPEAAAGGQAVTLAANVADNVRLERRFSVGKEGSAFEIVSTVANATDTPQPGDLRAAFALNLGSTDDVTAVLPARGDKGTLSLSLPETDTQQDLSFTGADVADGVTLANHAENLGVRIVPTDAPIERAWIRVDAKRGSITFEVQTRAELAAGAAAELRQQVEVLRDVSAVPKAASTGATQHRALRLVVQDDRIPIGKYGTWGWIEEDPAAEGGFSIHLPNTHIEWCCQYMLSPGQFEPDTKYDVFARIRVDRKGDQGVAFWAGVYDTVNGVGLGTVQPNVTDIPDGDWHLYKLGTVVPAQGQYVWCGPYGNPESVGGVWLDHFEVKAAD